jgi:mannose-1-phosphate guanylyltransferase / phosphomannomutase
MAYILEWLRRHGFTEVLATLHYRADDIRREFGDGRSFGLDLTYRVEQEPLGTAGAIRLAREWVGDEPFLVVSGDALTDVDLRGLLERHQETGAWVTLGLKHVLDPAQYGVVGLDARGMVTRFQEKPGPGRAFSTLVNTGIYCVESKVLEWLPADQPCDWSHTVFPRLLAERHPLSGHLLEGYWCDIGSMVEYRQAQWDVLTGAVRLDLPDLQADRDIRAGREVCVERAAVIEGPVLLGVGCCIERDALVLPGTILGERTVIRSGACVWNAILGGNCCVESDALLRDSVLDDHVRVGAGATVMEGVVVGRGCNVAAGHQLQHGERMALEQDLVAPLTESSASQEKTRRRDTDPATLECAFWSELPAVSYLDDEEPALLEQDK